MRILREHLDFKDLVSRVLRFDYLGSLVTSSAMVPPTHGFVWSASRRDVSRPLGAIPFANTV